MSSEDVLCYIMTSVEDGRRRFTQLEISDVLGVSLGTVNYIINKLSEMGAIVKYPRRFEVINPKKVLLFWATHHKQKIQYSARVRMRVHEIENMMPPGIFTAYSGARLYYDIDPADYSEVFIYADCNEVKERFSPYSRKSLRGELSPNVICLKPLKCFEILNFRIAPLSLLYVDLFNIPTWYATEYLRAVEVVLDGILE